MCLIGSFAVILRLLFLSSDPYTCLDWSTGLLTDESFYAHNARNLALFSRARMDEFNNMLLSPLIHLKQWMVFSVFGVGFEQARILAAITSLVSLALFFATLNRAFGLRVAAFGLLFLGLDHTYLLYSRMSLLDSYAVLPCAAAFYCFVRGISEVSRLRAIWLVLCGASLAIAVTNRSLCIYLLPVPAIALWTLRTRLRDILFTYGGFGIVAGMYAALWFLPNREEIGRMTHYYRTVQLQPKSAGHFLETLYHNLLGDRRGLAPYLFRHTPVLLILTLIGVWQHAADRNDQTEPRDSLATAAKRYLVSWLLLGWALVFVLGYSPSRYYVTIYPALAALAATTLEQIPRAWPMLLHRRNRIQLAVVTWFLTYHLTQSIFHRDSAAAIAILYGLPTTLAAVAFHLKVSESAPQQTVKWALAAWAVVNIAWLGHWLGTLQWTQSDMAAWIHRNLPANSVVIGDVGAGLGLGLPFRTVNVIPHLCNDLNPVERYAGAPRYAVILDGPWKEGYWITRYPKFVNTESLLVRQRVLNWDVGVYVLSGESKTKFRSGVQ